VYRRRLRLSPNVPALEPPAGDRSSARHGTRAGADIFLALVCVGSVGLAVARYETRGRYAAVEDTWPIGTAGPVAAAPGIARQVAVFVESTCSYCAEEMPFYRQLADAHADDRSFRLWFVGTERVETLEAYVAGHGFAKSMVMPVRSAPALKGIPTVLFIDASGRVTRSWQGVLSARQKQELLTLR
jgi:hypothetical protein